MPIPRYKDIVDLIKKGSTLEAQEKILELREAAIELQEENLVLKEDNSSLKQQLQNQTEIQFDGAVYWKGDDTAKEGPFCPTCFDTKQLLVRLHRDGTDWHCNACQGWFYP